MAIIDNLKGAWIAKAGQASPYDEVNGQFASDGTITATLALTQDGGEDYHWNYSGGGYVVFPAPSNLGARVGNSDCTFAVRFRVQTRGNDYDNYVLTSGTGGAGGSNGLKIANNGTSTGTLRVEWRYATGALAGGISVTYTTGDIITIVSRGDAFSNAGAGTHEIWVSGGSGDTPDYSASFGTWANYSNNEGHFLIYGLEDVDVFEHAYWSELKTPTECRALATDLRGELETALGGANLAPTETTPIGTINATVGVALTYDLTQNFSDDDDILNFAVNGGGTALPSWASISGTNIVGTPAGGDIGTTSGHVLDFDDGFNATDQSTAFAITVATLPSLLLEDIVTGANVPYGPGDLFTVDVISLTDGANVLHLTGQEPDSGADMLLANAAFTVSVTYKVALENETTGEVGIAKVTAT